MNSVPVSLRMVLSCWSLSLYTVEPGSYIIYSVSLTVFFSLCDSLLYCTIGPICIFRAETHYRNMGKGLPSCHSEFL